MKDESMKGVLSSFIPPPFEFWSFHFFPPRGPLSLGLRERTNQDISMRRDPERELPCLSSRVHVGSSSNRGERAGSLQLQFEIVNAEEQEEAA
jgi:hypothetical protein